MDHSVTPEAEAAFIRHPLDPITADEILALKEILAQAGHTGPQLRYSYVMLREPTREALSAFSGGVVPREIGVLLTNVEAQTVRDMVVDMVASKIILDRPTNPATDGCGRGDLQGRCRLCRSPGQTRDHRSRKRHLCAALRRHVRLPE
jgi:primary-amine oxidase